MFVENFFSWFLRIEIKVLIMVKFILLNEGKYFFKSDWYFFLFINEIFDRLMLVFKLFFLSLLRYVYVIWIRLLGIC